jgi:amidase
MRDAVALAGAIRSGRTTAGAAIAAALGAAAAAVFDVRAAQDPARQAVFAGVPLLVKDLGGPFAGLPMRCGSGMLPPVRGDSTLAARFRAAGFLPFGLSTSPEFGLSLASEPACGPVARHPQAPELSPGGSSGGAAAAVAAGIVAIAHATDAGGSIRVPAACCGLVGLKPGRGVMPAGPGFGNHLGGIASELVVSRSVRDTAAALAALAGRDAAFAAPGALAAPAACTAPATPSARHSTAQRRFRRGRMDVWAGCMASGNSGRWSAVFHQLFTAPVKLSTKHHDCLPFCRTSAAGQPADHAGPEPPQNVPG